MHVHVYIYKNNTIGSGTNDKHSNTQEKTNYFTNRFGEKWLKKDSHDQR